MDSYDYSDEALQPGRDGTEVIWNVLTVIVVLITLCLCVGITALLINPQLSINPFPPPMKPAPIQTPTVTPTPKQVLPPTWTPTFTPQFTLTLTPTNTAVPTNTPQIVESPTPPTIIPPSTDTPSETPGEAQLTATPSGDMPFVLHPGDPVAINNIAHSDLGCDWMGVAGQAYDLSLAPIEEGLFVKLQGTVDGKPIEILGTVGMMTAYGPGSYEFVLGDQPIDSTQTLWVQLLDQAMLPLSDQVYFDTFADCEKNLILINFNQVR
jgi:hypothetical protein